MKRPDIMPVAPDPNEVPTPCHVIFTDLDGSLLDHDTYSWAEASEALSLCRRKGVPVVMVSSKTGSEMAVLAKEMALSAPFVSENGGGIFIPEGTFDHPPDGAVWRGEYLKYSLGTPYSDLVSALQHIREELGWDLRGFSDMDEGEISLRKEIPRLIVTDQAGPKSWNQAVLDILS